jgi:hypothetical protein
MFQVSIPVFITLPCQFKSLKGAKTVLLENSGKDTLLETCPNTMTHTMRSF